MATNTQHEHDDLLLGIAKVTVWGLTVGFLIGQGVGL